MGRCRFDFNNGSFKKHRSMKSLSVVINRGFRLSLAVHILPLITNNIKAETDATIDHFLMGEVEETFEDFLTRFSERLRERGLS